MTAAQNLTPYCAAAACDLNLAGWAHVPWDCDTPLPAPTMDAETVAALPVERRPWVQGSARAFARLNPGLCPPREPGEELPEKVMLTGQTEPTPLEKVGNFNECIKDGTFKLASEAEAPAAKPAAKPK